MQFCYKLQSIESRTVKDYQDMRNFFYVGLGVCGKGGRRYVWGGGGGLENEVFVESCFNAW